MLTYAIIQLFACLIGLVCAYGLAFPHKLMNQVNTFWQKKSAMYIAISVRLILGLHLIAIAPFSKFPLAMKLVGYLAIVAAIAMAIIGRERIDHLLKWFIQSPQYLIRIWLIVGLAFAGFLFYAII